MLYYSLIVYNCVNYGITTWGRRTKSKKHEIEVEINTIVKTITWNKKFSHLYQNLNLLKLNDIYKLELTEIMHKHCSNKLPIAFHNGFTKIEKIHIYVTRGAKKTIHFLSRVNKTAGQKKIRVSWSKSMESN